MWQLIRQIILNNFDYENKKKTDFCTKLSAVEEKINSSCVFIFYLVPIIFGNNNKNAENYANQYNGKDSTKFIE